MEGTEGQAPAPGIEQVAEGEEFPETESNGHTPDEGTVFARLREQRARITRDRYVDLPVAGYDNNLVARYTPIDWDEVKKIGSKAAESRNPRRELIASATLIVRCNSMLLVRLKDDGDLIPMHEVPGADEFDGEPVTWATDALDLALGLTTAEDGSELPPPRTSRERVLRVFKNDLAVVAHYQELSEWLESSKSQDDEDFSEG